MVDSMAAAGNVLGEAIQKCGAAQQALMAAADGPMNDAKEVVRMVFNAGFELPGLNEALGMLEECQNEAHALVGKLSAAAAKIDEAQG